MKKIYLNLFFLTLTIFVSIYFIGFTQTNYDTGYGDFYVFLSIHQLMDVNYTLYKEIWDHKDIGFYLFNHFFYKALGIPGLFFSTLLIIILFYFSLNYYLKKENIFKNHYFISTLIIFFIVSIDSFIATHGETQAPLLILSGIFLYSFNKYISGILFILAITIKISGLPIVLAFFLFMLINKKPFKAFFTSEILPLLILIFSIIILFFIYSNIFSSFYLIDGWREITSFNKIYAETIRGNKLFSLNSRDLTIDIIRIFFYFTTHTKIFFILCLFSFIINFLFIKKFNRLEIIFFFKYSLLFLFLIFAALGVMYLHIPVAFHHYQFLNPFLIVYSLVNISLLLNKFRYEKIIYISIFALFLINTQLIKNSNNFINFFNPINGEGELSKELNLLDNNDFIILAGNHVKLDYSSLIRNKKNMSCRFFYQLEHILDNYYLEFKECIDNEPKTIFLLKNKSLLKIFYGKYYDPIMNLLENKFDNGYINCGKNNFFYIFSKDKNYCDLLN